MVAFFRNNYMPMFLKKIETHRSHRGKTLNHTLDLIF